MFCWSFALPTSCSGPTLQTRAEATLHRIQFRGDQHGRKHSLSSPSSDRGQVDPPSRGLRHAPQEVAGDNRSVCVLSESPLWCLFCSFVVSRGCEYRCHALVLGLSRGLHVSTFHVDFLGVGEAASFPGCGSISDRTVLASEGMVPRSARSPDRASSGASTQVGSVATATRSEVPSKYPHAKASCLETLRQFA